MAKWVYERYTALVDFSTFPRNGRSNPGRQSTVYQYGPDWTTRRELVWRQTKVGEVYASSDPSLRDVATWLKKRDSGYSEYVEDTFPNIMNRFGKKGELLESDIIAEDGTYPDNGIHTDGFWYIKVKKAFPEIKMWIYEKWDIKWDWDKLSEVSTFSEDRSGSRTPFSRPAFSEDDESWENKAITKGDIFTGARIAQWNNGATSEIYIATSNQTVSWRPIAGLPGGGYYLARLDVRHTVESDYTKNTMHRLKKKNVLMESGIIAEDGIYPDDGIHRDGYWYVKVKRAFPDIKVVDGTTLKTATSAYVVQGGVLKSVADVYIVQGGQIKKAK